jgi:hypothetical protein
MADIDLKTETPDTTLPTDGFLFGADSQSAASPSVYPVQSLATTLLGSTTLNGATVTADAPVLNLSQTWNASGTTFTGLKLNVTDTASAAASSLLDLQVGGDIRFVVGKSFVSVRQVPLNIWAANPTLQFANQGGALRTSLIGLSSNLRLGSLDIATPGGQTLSVPNVVAGTSNTAGADFTIAGSQGTGTGAGGSIVFKVAPAGASGTAQNALVAALTISSDRKVIFEDATSVSSFDRGIFFSNNGQNNLGFTRAGSNNISFSVGTTPYYTFNSSVSFQIHPNSALSWRAAPAGSDDVSLFRDAADTLAQRRGTNAQESRVYGSYTSATNFQRLSIKTLRESSGALSGASYTTTIAIPAYAHLIGVTTRVTTEVTGATTYDVGDGSDVDLWGAAVGVTLGSESRTADFTDVAAVGPAATSRTVTLTANGSNFTAGVVEICLHYLTTEAD